MLESKGHARINRTLPCQVLYPGKCSYWQVLVLAGAEGTKFVGRSSVAGHSDYTSLPQRLPWRRPGEDSFLAPAN